MKNSVFAFIIMILGMLEITLLNSFRVFSIKPDLLLISVVIISLILRHKWSFSLSVFAGVLKDAFTANTFGINTLLFPLWNFLIIKLLQQITIDSRMLRLGLICAVAVLHNTITGILLIYLQRPVALGYFFRIVFVGSAYTALVFPFVFDLFASRFLAGFYSAKKK